MARRQARGKPIEAATINRIPAGAERMAAFAASAGIPLSGWMVGADPDPGVWAELSGASSPYSWSEVYQDATTGTWTALTGGRAGTSNAHELNGVSGLSGKVARLTPAEAAANEWRFAFPRIGPTCPDSSLCCLVYAPCSDYPDSVSVRFQGPSGEDTTQTVSAVVPSPSPTYYAQYPACYADPSTGDWTITVTAAGYCTATRVVHYGGICQDAATVVLCPTSTPVTLDAGEECGAWHVPGVDVSFTIEGRFRTPLTAPTISTYDASTTSLAVGSYRFKYTIADGSGGETAPSPARAHTQGTTGKTYRLGLPDPPCGGGFNVYSSDDGGTSYHLYASNVRHRYALLGTAHSDAGAAPPSTNTTGGSVAGSGTTNSSGTATADIDTPNWLCALGEITSVTADFTADGAFGLADGEIAAGEFSGSITACGGLVSLILRPDGSHRCFPCCTWPLPDSGELSYTDSLGSATLAVDGSGCRWLGAYAFDEPCSVSLAYGTLTARDGSILWEPLSRYATKQVFFRNEDDVIVAIEVYGTSRVSVLDDLCSGDGSGAATGSYAPGNQPAIPDGCGLGDWVVTA